MAVPMIDDVELKAVQRIRQETDQGFVRHRIAGLDGTVHQKLGRQSHRVVLEGVLLPETAADDLKTLQQKAASGAEVTFTSDITTALSVDKMVIESLAADQTVGHAGQFSYSIVVSESPPLPPPAELSPFGGLGDFGVGDLGFDPGALGDTLGSIADQAGALADAASSALDAVQGLSALSALANLGDLTNPLQPLTATASQVGELGASVSKAVGDLTGLLP